jgi:hypothetical protein
MKDFLTLTQFARKIGVCERTAQSVLVGRNGPKYLRAGRRYLVPVTAYEKWTQPDDQITLQQ